MKNHKSFDPVIDIIVYGGYLKTRRCCLSFIAAVLCLSFGANTLLAQTAADTLRNGHSQPVIQVLHGVQSLDEKVQTIGTIGNDQLCTSPVYNILGAAQGRLPGLNINFTGDGSLVASYGMNVRSARQNIILVDGIERSFVSINPEQVESITVLKDALSTVLFGQRSSSGILNIITKKGGKGIANFSFTVQTGFEQALRLPKKVNAADYATLLNESYLNDNPNGAANKPFTDEVIQKYRDHSDPYVYPDVDWYKQVLNKTAPVTRYNFNVYGSSRIFRYYVDLDYLRENALLKTSDVNSYNTNGQINRFLLRSNLGVQVTPTTYMQINLFGRQERYNEPGSGLADIFSKLLSNPVDAYPVYNPDGSLGGRTDYGGNVNLWGLAINRGYKFTDSRDMAFDVTLTQRLDVFAHGLYAEATGSYTSRTSYTTTRTKDFATYDYNAEGNYTKFGTDGDMGNAGAKGLRQRFTYMKGLLGYKHEFGKHGVDAIGFIDLEQIQDQAVNTGYVKDYLQLAARANYNYDHRYVVEGAISRAKYNWFAPGYRWATYWAAGASWNAHNESFIKDMNIFSTLKPRYTYGLTGQAITNYGEYIQSYQTGAGNLRTTPYGLKYSYEGTAATFLKPEESRKMDIGIDLGLLGDRLTATVDYFKNKYTGVVATPSVGTAILGAAYPRINTSKFSYWGTEYTVNWQDHINEFNYHVGANLSLTQSNTDYLQEVPYLYASQSTVGSPIGMTYGYQSAGIFQSQEEIDNWTKNGGGFLANAAQSTIKPGDIKYKDLTGDGVIDTYDRTVLGSKAPKGYYGITAGFSYKGFDFNMFMQGTLNRQMYISGAFMNGSGGKLIVLMTEYSKGRWTKDHPTNTQPRLWFDTNNNNNQTSDFYIYNADYMRLKNMEIGYTLPQELTKKIKFNSVRFFVNGMNLLTTSELFKIRDDVDPEAYGDDYPTMRTINFGVNIKL